MNRALARRRLALEWWCLLLGALAPLLLLNLLLDGALEGTEVVQMPLFIAGLLAMFISLPLFSGYKRALIATEAARDTQAEPAAWSALTRRRRIALLAAELPAWIACLGLLVGLNGVALMLLALSSLLLFLLYRIPAALV